jgi:hypothetical protein
MFRVAAGLRLSRGSGPHPSLTLNELGRSVLIAAFGHGHSSL